MTVFDIKNDRKNWAENLPDFPKNNLVFIDESGVNTDMTRLYGRAEKGDRCVDKAPLNTPASTTIISSIRLNGETAYTTFSGGTTGEKFVGYLKNILIPTLKKGDIIVMDNMRSHHVKEVKNIIENAGMKLLYLSPYSPDFNPIEKCGQKSRSFFVNLKQEMALRKNSVKTKTAVKAPPHDPAQKASIQSKPHTCP